MLSENDQETVATVIVDTVKKALEPVYAKIAALESKTETCLKDSGTWRTNTPYKRGDVAQFRGTRWVCIKEHTSSGPTADHSFWQLWTKGST